LSVTRPFDSSPALYYKWSIVTMRLSCTVMEIWRLKCWTDTQRTLRWFCTLSSAMHCIEQTTRNFGQSPTWGRPAPSVRLDEHLRGWNSLLSKVAWPELKCISILRTRIVDWGWVKICAYNFFVNGPKFTNFFCPTQEEALLSMKFVSSCRYLDRFLRYSWSDSNVVLNRAEFWMFLLSQILRGQCFPKVVNTR